MTSKSINPKKANSYQAITSTLFESYLNCPTKCFLNARGETSFTENPYAKWVQTNSEAYRNNAIARLKESLAPDSIIASPEGGDLKTSDWHYALDFVAFSSEMEAKIQAVERIASEGRGKPAQFIPLRFILYNKISKNDKLLLGFEAFILSELIGRKVEVGKIIHGDGHTILKVKTATLFGSIKKVIGKIAALLATSSPPDLVLNRHCAECEFHAYCRQKAIEKNDLSLLSGLSGKERKKHNNNGIFTVTQLSYIFRPRKPRKGTNSSNLKYYHSLKALAIREQKIFVAGKPKISIVGTPVFLDVEGIPDQDFYYLIGVRFKAGDSFVQHSFWADDISQEKTIWRNCIHAMHGRG